MSKTIIVTGASRGEFLCTTLDFTVLQGAFSTVSIYANHDVSLPQN